MTLQWSTIDVPLGAGLDTKTNEKLLKPPACADLVDAVFPASGVAGYETRRGYERIRTSTELASIDALATRDNELVAFGEGKAYSVSELANNVDLIELGDVLAVGVDESTLSTQSDNQTGGQIIAHQGIEVVCWYSESDSRLVFEVTDSVTGALLVNNVISNSTRAKLCAVGSAVIIVCFNSSATSLRAVTIPTYSPTSFSQSEIVADAHADALFDVIETTSERALIAYKSSTGTASLRGVLIDAAADVTDSVEYAASHATTCLAVTRTAELLCVAAATASNVDLYNTPGLDVFGSVTTNGGSKSDAAINIAYTAQADDTVATGSEKHYLFFEIAGSSGRFNYVQSVIGDGQSDVDVDTPTSTVLQSSLASSAFQIGALPYVHVAFDATLQRQYFLLDIDLNVQAKCCTIGGIGIGAGITAEHLPRVIDMTWAPVYREHLEIDVDPDVAETEANVYAQSGLKKVVYTENKAPQSTQFGEALYTQAGTHWQYDGRRLTEQGFHIYPEGVTAAASNSTGSLSSSSSYSYRVYYEWTNDRGERQRSATATIVTEATGASDDTITLTIPTLAHTSKPDVSIVVYRTLADPVIVGGAPLYRVSSTDPTATGNNGYVDNDTSSDTVTFIDGLADSDITSRELDYQNSGELDHVTLPTGYAFGEAKRRVLVSNGSRTYYSKTNNRGRDQLEFNNTLWFDVPLEGGDIVAYGELNFHIVVFKRGRIYVVSGDGKDNFGNGSFNSAQVASLDVGCVDPNSVVNIPQGLMFRSEKGIWRIGHALDVVYAGDRVEAYNSQTVTSATLVPAENHVIFLTDVGSTLVYNYLVNEWSRFTNHQGTCSTIWAGTYVYGRINGRIYKQSATQYTDDGTHYAMRFITAPIGVRGTQGKQKIRHIRLLGEYYSPHELRVGLRFNHEPGQSDVGTWDPSDGITVSLYGDGAYGDGAYGGSGNPVYQARFNMPRQKCQTVQFIIDTRNTGTAGRAMSIQAIQVSVGAKRGLGNVSIDSTFSASGASTSTGE